MPLYYLNKNAEAVTFYTDTGSLFDVLQFAKDTDFIAISYLIGRSRRTNKLLYLRNGGCSKGINSCLKDQLPAAVQRKFLLDSEINPLDFSLKFQSGHTAFTNKGDIIIRLTNDERITDLMDAFHVPLLTSATLLAQPGLMLSVVRRTGSWVFYGYFEQIEDWLNLPDLEKTVVRYKARPCPN